MGRPLNTKQYPGFFFDILNKLKDDPSKPVRLPCESKASMLKMQLNFLTFRKAAVKEGWNTGESIMVFPDLNAYTTKQITDVDGRCILEIWHMDYTPEALKIKRQLEGQP